jgi:adenylate kinase family enzyme
MHQLEDFERAVGSIDHIYILECPVDVCVGRLLPRARLDDKLDNINARFATYRAKTGAVIKIFEERNAVTSLDATKSLDEVSQELEGYVSKFVGQR